MDIEWAPPLRHKQGSKRRLAGLDIYYDFDWKQVFRHSRAVFPNGQSLAELVARECPDEKKPTLLLTARDDVAAGIRQVDDRHVVVVPIQEYLNRAGADAASTFYARLSGTPLTQLATLSDAVFSEAELGQFLERHLDRERLTEWANAAAENRAILDDVATDSNATEDLLALLNRIQELPVSQLRSIAERLAEVAGETGMKQVLRAITETESGRESAVNVLADRLSERIADVRSQLVQYRALIDRPDVSETDVHRFLAENPWIVGLMYVRARPHVEIPRGEVDFVLERYDGCFDVLELKGPGDPILVESSRSGDRPPSASAYSLGPSLSKALAQAHLYRANLRVSTELAQQYGLTDPRQPRIVILIGRQSDLSETGREILRQLNLSLHRVEIVPYDLVAARTGGWLTNVEELLDPSLRPTR